jgi:hypothetical protein
MGKATRLMEAIVSLLVPPACREEVVGDLHERYRSPARYLMDAIRTVPFVIVSRIRRTADAPLVLIHGLSFYLSFLITASFLDEAFLQSAWVLVRLAVPPVAVVLGLVVEAAYANSSLPVRGTVIGLFLSFLVQVFLRAISHEIAAPADIFALGIAIGWAVCWLIQRSVARGTNQMQGINAPAFWLKREWELPPGAIQSLRVMLAAYRSLGTGRKPSWDLPEVIVLTPLIGVLVVHTLRDAYRFWKGQ